MSTITVSTTIFENTSVVWDLYTQPKHIAKWYIFSLGWRCTHVECDIKSGGKYSAKMEAIDDSSCFEVKAVFDKVVPQKAISYILQDGRKVQTSFENLDGATRIETSFEKDVDKPIKNQQDRWSDILDNFKNYVEKGSV